MLKQKSFTFQLLVIGGFFAFFYVFFALATSIYRDYRLKSQINNFEQEIENLAQAARVKPEDVKYYNSPQYKDRYAKESLNLLNPGEQMILVPNQDYVAEQGEALLKTDLLSSSSVRSQNNPVQWREYFFGDTLTVKRSPHPLLPDSLKGQQQAL